MSHFKLSAPVDGMLFGSLIVFTGRTSEPMEGRRCSDVFGPARFSFSARLPALAQETREFAPAYSAMSGSMAWVWAAKEGGYFDKHGLEGGSHLHRRDGATFPIDARGGDGFGIGGGPSIINANIQRKSIVPVAGTPLNRMIMKIMATPQIKDRRRHSRQTNRRHALWHQHHFAARLFLKSWGPICGKGCGHTSGRQCPECSCIVTEAAPVKLGALSPLGPFTGREDGFCRAGWTCRRGIFIILSPMSRLVCGVSGERNKKF